IRDFHVTGVQTCALPIYEMFPTVHDQTLYFSSTGHVGMGGLDIFYAKGQKSQFDKAINMGFPINSASDDFAFVVAQDDYEGTIRSEERRVGKEAKTNETM